VASPRHTSAAASHSRSSSSGLLEQQGGPGFSRSSTHASDASSVTGGHRLKIVPKQGRVAHFTRRGLVLHDSSYLPADLVLYCTGYTKNYGGLPGSVQVWGAV
jgi:hypothetical protein